jgi:hypothetical protein
MAPENIQFLLIGVAIGYFLGMLLLYMAKKAANDLTKAIGEAFKESWEETFPSKPTASDDQDLGGCSECGRIDGSHHSDCSRYKPRE